MPTYEVSAPDGKKYLVDAPRGATQDQIIQYVQSQLGQPAAPVTAPPQPEQSGFFRQALDVPLQVARGGVGGIRMLADLFGAGSSASEALKSADTWLADLLSAEAQKDQRRVAQILKDAEDKGVLDQVKAGFQAFFVAPVDTLSQALGSTAPVLIAGLASGPVGAVLGTARLGAVAMPAVGAAMGVGEVKGSIYEAVEREYLNKRASPEMAKAKAQEAQSYASTNLPSLAVAGGLGALAGGVGIERPLVSLLSRGAVKDVAEQQALREAERGLISRVGLGALKEGAPEFAQASQSQLAQNIALRSEGFDVPLFRNVFGAGAMEGAAGAILGGGLAVPRTGVERLPGQQEGESDSAFARRMSREIEAARRAEQPLAPVTQPVTPPAAPTEPVVSTAPEGEDVFRFPDGSVGTLDQARAYAMNLPPEQRASTLQSILAQRVPREKTVPPDLFTQPAEKPAEQAAEGAAPTKPVVAEKPAEEAKPEVVEPVKPPAVAMTKEEEEVAADAAKEKPVQNFILNYPIVELPLDQLSLSKEVPQFKGDADTEGIVEKLEGTFDQRGVAPIQVWRRNDGRLEIISGRHRFDLAKRSGDKLIRAQVHDEATGFDADQASILDAELNIRDQQGKGRDYVAYFRKSGISEEDASARGLLGRSPGKPAFAIAKNGSEELVGAHRADIVSDAGAAAIANAAPGDSRLQAVGVKAIQEGKSPLAAVNIIKAVQEVSKGRPAPEGGDLFGFDDSAMREAEEMAKIATLKQNQLAQRLAAISGASRRPEIAKKEGIDIKDPDALKKREKELRQQRAAWDNWSSSSDLVQEIRKEMEPKAEEKPEVKPSAREAEPAKEAKEVPAEIQAKIDALGKALQRIMSRYGLRDVALRLVADMKAEGEYASKVLSLALDATDPVVALRHESIHALKELGFFTPAQWKSLERQAKEKWVDQYLKKKNVNRQPLQEGQMSRYDAYMKFYGGDEEAMLEEAIADAFADFSATKAPPGMLQALLKKIQNFFQAIKEAFGAEPDAERIFKKAERGELRAGPVAPDSWKDSEKEDADAEKYEEQNGILPYTSAGQIEAPVETPKLSIKAPYGEKELAKGKENHPVLNVPLNANGTVTLYFPTSNLSAREVAKTKRLKATSPTANRIYLTNESNPAAVRTRVGNIDQGPIEANVMVQVPPEMLQFDMEHSDGRKDFFIQLAEGNAFAEKMKMTKLFTLYKPRSEAIAKTTTIGDIGKGLESAISAYKQLSPADQRAKLAQARQVLKDEHNVGTLLGENGKLQKTRLNEYQLPEDIQNSVASLGLGLASAQKINERNLSTCPQSARCEGLCLGETSGQNQLYGGDGPFRAGPRLSQYLKTEALVMHPEEFGIVLYDEIKKFESWAKSDKGFEVITEENGEKSRVKKQVYTPAIRLNVTSDFPPKMLKPFIEGFPGVRFYDYTKLATPGPIADNHHLTYSSDGAAQVVEGKTVGVGSNWDAMIKRLNNGFNVAMAFTSKRDMPDFVLDEKTGDKFQVWNGDNYDARFLDPRPGQKGNLFNKGMIIGLTNKDRTGRPEDAALRHDGFFVDYDRERDGDAVVIRDQEKIKAGKKIIPIAKPSLRDASWSEDRIATLMDKYSYLQNGREKDTKAYSGFVRPEDFLAATTSAEDRGRLEGEKTPLDVKRLAKEDQEIFLDIKPTDEPGVYQITGHEGRHRMMALRDAGVRSVPVVFYTGGTKNAEIVEEPYFKAQEFRGDKKIIKAQRGFSAMEMIPISWDQRNNIKETFGGKADVRFSLRDKLGLYSELEAKVSQGPGKGTAEAWKGYINGLTQKGVKPEEIEWSGVRDWLDLQKGSVTKEDLLSYLKNGGVQVEEVVLGGETRLTDEEAENIGYRFWPAVEAAGFDVETIDEKMGAGTLDINSLPEDLRSDARLLKQDYAARAKPNLPKYRQYSLPGGENYREVLLTLPYRGDMQTPNGARFTQEELADPIVRRTVERIGAAPAEAYRSPHWDQPNVLAHIRVNDRTDAEGNKVLFVEEIQSDWGQEGKKKGFKGQPIFMEGMRDQPEGFLGLSGSDIPMAPFVTKTEGWLNLALKRIMVMAGDGGYDKVAFVNGDQSAERYDLSKQIDRIDYNKNGNGTFNMSAIRNGAEVFSKEELSEGQLADTVGKELAAKMVRGEGKDVAELDEVDRFEPEEDIYTDKDFDYEATKVKSLAGLDLKVGGEGMKTFYDTIVPTAVKKLLPKVGGGRMETVNIAKGFGNRFKAILYNGQTREFNSSDEAYSWVDRDHGGAGRVESLEVGLQQPGFDVTPSMKERVRTTGLPRFSLRDTVGTYTDAEIDQAVQNGFNARSAKDLRSQNELFRALPSETTDAIKGYWRAQAAANASREEGDLRSQQGPLKAAETKAWKKARDAVAVVDPSVLEDPAKLYPYMTNFGSDLDEYLEPVEATQRRLAPDLEQAGVTPEVIPLFLKYRNADKAVGSDPYLTGRGAKAAKTRALNALYEALGGVDQSRVPLYRLHMAYDMRGESGLYADETKPDIKASLRDTVNVDGTERPTTSSTNKPIYPTEEGTKNFWRWFKDSAVVDDDGRPMVVYHGTRSDILTFDKSRQDQQDAGFWFGTAQAANQYAASTRGAGDNVMPVYLSISNPKVYTNRDVKITPELINKLEAQGYDGVLRDFSAGEDADRYPSGAMEWAVFRPTQIKSAIGNVGKFDPVDPSIKASLRDVIDPAIRARIDQTTTPREERSFIKRITEAIAPKSASSFRAAFLDRYNRLSEYDKELARQMGGAPLLADASSHSAALLSDLSAGVLAGAMGVHDGVGGIPAYVNGYTKIVNNNNTVKGPIAIFAPLAKFGDATAYQAYQFWAGVKRGTRFDREGREQLFEKADIQKADDLRKQFLAMGVDFEAIQKEWIKFNDGLVQYLKDTGVLSDAAAKEFVKYSDYIPFYRQADGEETVGPQVFASLSGVRAPKKLKGSETPIAEFLETVVRNVQYSIEAGMKNVAAQRAVNTAVAIGQANRLNYVSSAPNVVKVLENGKTSYYETKDMLFVEAMKSLNLGDLPFIGLLAGPANVLRNLVTKDPAFMLANMMRDSVSAWVSSGVKMTPMVDTMTNFGKALRGQSPEYSALLNSGVIGGYDYSQGVEISARRFDRALRKKAGVYTTEEKLARPFTSLWDALEAGTQASDAATRMEVYKKTLAATGNEAEALLRAVEVMNFNRKGNNPLVRVLTAAVPFLNARMQGLDVLYRAAFGKGTEANAKEIQKSFFVRGMTIAALSTMYWMLAHEDDEWKKQEQETRDNYWILGKVKIPIPFEIGVLFKVIPERILEYSFGDDTGKDFLKSMARQLTSTLAFNPIPQTVLPIVESVTNYSFFTQRPIVSQGLESVAPAYQVGPSTSRLAELAGEASKGLPSALQLSPMKVDQMIRGYTGTLGGYMVDLFDAIYDMNSDSPKASKRFEQMPVIKRFAVDPQARGQVTAYYELKNSVDEAVRTANLLERSMKPQEWADYVQENQGLFLTKDYVLDMEKSMKDFREMKTFVRASDMDADEKRDITLNITTMENNMASNIQHIKKMIAAQ